MSSDEVTEGLPVVFTIVRKADKVPPGNKQ